MDDFRNIKIKAEEGDRKAQLELAKMYYYGQGVKQDYTEAAKWFEEVSIYDDAAAYLLGRMYYYGDGVRRNLTSSLKHLRYPARRNNGKAIKLLLKVAGSVGSTDRLMTTFLLMEACKILGNQFASGDVFDHDENEAERWYRKQAELLHKLTNTSTVHRFPFELAQMYEEGKGVDQDYKKAAEYYKKSAEKGNNEAQYFIGEMLYQGRNIKRDFKEALKWFRKAAEQGNAEAALRVAEMICKGHGIARNLDTAVKQITLSMLAPMDPMNISYERLMKEAEEGDPSMVFIGNVYHGVGVKKNHAKAAEWLQHIVDNTYSSHEKAQAEYLLGYMFYYGDGVKMDYQKAVKWLHLAAEQHDEESARVASKMLLARIYEKGHGVDRDRDEAVKLLTSLGWVDTKSAVVVLKGIKC